MQSEQHDFVFKVIFEGMHTVGKSSTTQRYVEGSILSGDARATIGGDLRHKTVIYDDKAIKLQLWDSQGGERFKSVTKIAYRGCNGILLMYDVTNMMSFEIAERYAADIQEFAPSNCQSILLGNKIDKEEARKVSFAEGSKLAARLVIPFFEISAKTGFGVEQALNELISRMIKASEGKIEKKDTRALEDVKGSENIQKLKQDYKTESKSRSCL